MPPDTDSGRQVCPPGPSWFPGLAALPGSWELREYLLNQPLCALCCLPMFCTGTQARPTRLSPGLWPAHQWRQVCARAQGPQGPPPRGGLRVARWTPRASSECGTVFGEPASASGSTEERCGGAGRSVRFRFSGVPWLSGGREQPLQSPELRPVGTSEGPEARTSRQWLLDTRRAASLGASPGRPGRGGVVSGHTLSTRTNENR